MNINTANEVYCYVSLLNKLNTVIHFPESASIPEYLSKTISDLCESHEGFKKDFHMIMKKLGEKYYKQIESKINSL